MAVIALWRQSVSAAIDRCSASDNLDLSIVDVAFMLRESMSAVHSSTPIARSALSFNVYPNSLLQQIQRIVSKCNWWWDSYSSDACQAVRCHMSYRALPQNTLNNYQNYNTNFHLNLPVKWGATKKKKQKTNKCYMETSTGRTTTKSNNNNEMNCGAYSNVVRKSKPG